MCGGPGSLMERRWLGILILCAPLCARTEDVVVCNVGANAEIRGAYVDGVPLAIASTCDATRPGLCTLTFVDMSESEGSYFSFHAVGTSDNTTGASCDASALSMTCVSTRPGSPWNSVAADTTWQSYSTSDETFDSTEWTLTTFNASTWASAEVSSAEFTCTGCGKNGDGRSTNSIWASGCNQHAYFRRAVPLEQDCTGSWTDWETCTTTCEGERVSRTFRVATPASLTGKPCAYPADHTEWRTCGDEDADGICDANDSCLGDSDNDANNDGICDGCWELDTSESAAGSSLERSDGTLTLLPGTRAGRSSASCLVQATGGLAGLTELSLLNLEAQGWAANLVDGDVCTFDASLDGGVTWVDPTILAIAAADTHNYVDTADSSYATGSRVVSVLMEDIATYGITLRLAVDTLQASSDTACHMNTFRISDAASDSSDSSDMAPSVSDGSGDEVEDPDIWDVHTWWWWGLVVAGLIAIAIPVAVVLVRRRRAQQARGERKQSGNRDDDECDAEKISVEAQAFTDALSDQLLDELDLLELGGKFESDKIRARVPPPPRQRQSHDASDADEEETSTLTHDDISLSGFSEHGSTDGAATNEDDVVGAAASASGSGHSSGETISLTSGYTSAETVSLTATPVSRAARRRSTMSSMCTTDTEAYNLDLEFAAPETRRMVEDIATLLSEALM